MIGGIRGQRWEVQATPLHTNRKFSASIQNMDIRKSNNATAEMVIADFFQSKNIADAVVELPRFTRLVRVCRLVGDEFVIPNCRKIGGELLDLNYETKYKSNKDKLLKEASVFSLAFLGDGTTIKRMPLMNVLSMTATVSTMTIAIQDCSSHTEEGGKKDAVYVCVQASGSRGSGVITQYQSLPLAPRKVLPICVTQ